MQKMAEAARPARILETRKTAPGLRLIDKWAVSGFACPAEAAEMLQLLCSSPNRLGNGVTLPVLKASISCCIP